MCRKIYSFLLGLSLIATSAFAQHTVEGLMALKPQIVGRYQAGNAVNQITLKMDFNSPVILNPADAGVLRDKTILRVELYYTAFQVSETFSQPKLNRERYEALQKLCPDIFSQNFTAWKIVGQTDCKTPSEAQQFFHGFVVTYLSAPDKVTAESEEKEIANLLHNDSLGHDTLIVNVKYKVRKTKKRSGLYLPVLKSKRDKGVRYATRGIWRRKAEYYTKVDTIVHKSAHREFVSSKDASSFMKRLPDSTIFNVLNRHDWKNILFVCDVTGSMAPYSAEVLLWHKLNYQTQKARYFTFFNDGDNMPDRKKKIGRTGGIYFIEAGNFEAVEITLYNTMRRGSGGDAPENNCEAIIRSLQHMPDAGEVVMVADNFANIKDLALAEQIKRPVRIILCGADSGFINLDYLELARKTKGSVHIVGEDLHDLCKLNEGQTFTFGDKLFKIVNGKVVQVNPA
jgi:hypothetical protein